MLSERFMHVIVNSKIRRTGEKAVGQCCTKTCIKSNTEKSIDGEDEEFLCVVMNLHATMKTGEINHLSFNLFGIFERGTLKAVKML